MGDFLPMTRADMKARGWDENGVPTLKTLRKLKIVG